MQKMILALVVATIAAAPAAAQDNVQIADPDTNIAANETVDPALEAAPVLPLPAEDPGLTDATVTPETDEGGGFPWGLLGLLGLVGLIGRMRS